MKYLFHTAKKKIKHLFVSHQTNKDPNQKKDVADTNAGSEKHKIILAPSWLALKKNLTCLFNVSYHANNHSKLQIKTLD